MILSSRLQGMNDIPRLHPDGGGRHSQAASTRPAIRSDLFGFEPLGLVCAALFLAWVALVLRIVSII
jgi:hypothetical protein